MSLLLLWSRVQLASNGWCYAPQLQSTAGSLLAALVIGGGALAAPAPLSAQAINQLQVPARPANAATGTQFKDTILNMTRDAREVAIYREVAKGNIPNFQRTLVPITLTGGGHTAVIYALPDYLAIGSDADHFYMPMTPILAQWVADLTSTTLPTRKMVGSIWTASTVKLNPSPIAPSAAMVTVPVFWDHNTTVRGQRNANATPQGALVGGHKKDVVVSPQLVTYTNFKRVAIYGWHQSNGVPIQNIYFGHEDTYADYSDVIRLIIKCMLLNGNETTVEAVLLNPGTAPALHDEVSPYTTSAPPRYDVPPAPAAPSAFPYADAFPSTGRQLTGWVNRFQAHAVGAFSPAAPGGDGFVLTVRDPSGGIDTTRIGDSEDTDYFVQADIYCDYRPELTADGLERVGIFARDDGNGIFCGTNTAGTIRGNNYALTWDSNTGRIQCLRTVNGTPTDLLTAPVFQTGTAWRKFRLECVGNQISFKIDGSSILSVTDTARAAGQFGIGYQELFTTNANIRGTRADNFLADRLNLAAVSEWKKY